jgi:hypothetical protein
MPNKENFSFLFSGKVVDGLKPDLSKPVKTAKKPLGM